MNKRMDEMIVSIFGRCEFSTQEADAIFDTDPAFRAAMDEFGRLERAMGALIRDEGIVMPADFHVEKDRVSPSDWEKMSALAREFMDAGEAMVEALARAFRAEGCDL